jgi:hypothetical protein
MKSYHLNLGSGIAGLFHTSPRPTLPCRSRRSPDTVRATSLSFRDLMILRGWRSDVAVIVPTYVAAAAVSGSLHDDHHRSDLLPPETC